jgi:hypothetical protein
MIIPSILQILAGKMQIDQHSLRGMVEGVKEAEQPTLASGEGITIIEY